MCTTVFASSRGRLKFSLGTACKSVLADYRFFTSIHLKPCEAFRCYKSHKSSRTVRPWAVCKDFHSSRVLGTVASFREALMCIYIYISIIKEMDMCTHFFFLQPQAAVSASRTVHTLQLYLCINWRCEKVKWPSSGILCMFSLAASLIASTCVSRSKFNVWYLRSGLIVSPMRAHSLESPVSTHFMRTI